MELIKELTNSVRRIGLVALAVTVAMVLVRAQFTPPGGGGSGGINVPNPYTSMHAGASYYASPEPCVTIVSTVTTDFTTGTSQQVKLFTAPALWSPRSFRVEETTLVTASGTTGGAAISALALCIGTVGTPCGYEAAVPLNIGAGSAGFREVSPGATLAATPTSTQDVYLQLINTSANPIGTFANLTAGAITVRSCGVALQ